MCQPQEHAFSLSAAKKAPWWRAFWHFFIAAGDETKRGFVIFAS
jgi:hypothetical protein